MKCNNWLCGLYDKRISYNCRYRIDRVKNISFVDCEKRRMFNRILSPMQMDIEMALYNKHKATKGQVK